MMARNLVAASLVLAIGVSGVAACSAGDSTDGSSQGGKVTMTFWHNATTGDGKAFWEKTVADFTAANPNVKIEIQSIQNEDLDGKLQTALNSGDAPTSSSSVVAARWRRWRRPVS
jgi:raffinose/stachyose/melibiose transport system substrate-binding protein